jgi:hypothetical protein
MPNTIDKYRYAYQDACIAADHAYKAYAAAYKAYHAHNTLAASRDNRHLATADGAVLLATMQAARDAYNAACVEFERTSDAYNAACAS